MENEARGGCACGAVITVTVWLDRVDKYRSERRNVMAEPLLTRKDAKSALASRPTSGQTTSTYLRASRDAGQLEHDAERTT